MVMLVYTETVFARPKHVVTIFHSLVLTCTYLLPFHAQSEEEHGMEHTNMCAHDHTSHVLQCGPTHSPLGEGTQREHFPQEHFFRVTVVLWEPLRRGARGGGGGGGVSSPSTGTMGLPSSATPAQDGNNWVVHVLRRPLETVPSA